MSHIDTWKDTLSEAAEECSLVITDKQLQTLAEAVSSTHDNWDLVHYTPPASDHHEHERRQAEQRHKAELAELQRSREEERREAEDRIRSLRIRNHHLEEELNKAQR